MPCWFSALRALQLGGAELLAVLKGPDPVTDHHVGAGVTTLLDLAFEERLGQLLDDVARRHGCIPGA